MYCLPLPHTHTIPPQLFLLYLLLIHLVLSKLDSSQLSHFLIDLDLPPEYRFQEVSLHFREQILDNMAQ